MSDEHHLAEKEASVSERKAGAPVSSGCLTQSLALLMFLGAFYFVALVLIPAMAD